MRRISFVLFLMLAVSVFAQNSGGGASGAASSGTKPAQGATSGAVQNTAPNPMTTAPASVPPNQAPLPAPNGYVNYGGYVSSAPMSQPVLVTPSVSTSIASPNPVGAVSGTGNNVVGASSSAINTMPSTPEPPVMPQAEISNPNANAVNTTAEEVSAAAALNTAAQAPNMNLGVRGSYGVGGVGESAGVGGTNAAAQPQTSLGDIARQARARHNTNAHVYTNDDVNRVAQNDRGNVLNNSNNTLPMSDQPQPQTTTTPPTTGGVAGTATSVAPSTPPPSSAPAAGQQQQPPAAQSPDHTPPRKRSPFGPPAQPPQ